MSIEYKMKIINYFFITVFLSSGYINAQQLQGNAKANPINKDTRKMSIVDTCNIRVLYALNADNIYIPETYVDLQRLEIGNKLSKYYSFFVFNNDSLCTEWKIKHPLAKSAPSYLGPMGKKMYNWSEYKYSEYFNDYKTNTLTEYARMPYGAEPDCKYSEDIPAIEWSIENDTTTVIGYLCQKATCYFRGRNYTAWFTTDIPISNGPWKFGGLPGLILKIYDNDKLYTFECIKIENGNFTIRKYDHIKDNKNVNRQKLLKLQKKLNENYLRIVGAVSLNGKKMPDPVSYEPLELE